MHVTFKQFESELARQGKSAATRRGCHGRIMRPFCNNRDCVTKRDSCAQFSSGRGFYTLRGGLPSGIRSQAFRKSQSACCYESFYHSWDERTNVWYGFR
jgi:hypothetical protein